MAVDQIIKMVLLPLRDKDFRLCTPHIVIPVRSRTTFDTTVDNGEGYFDCLHCNSWPKGMLPFFLKTDEIHKRDTIDLAYYASETPNLIPGGHGNTRIRVHCSCLCG